MPFSLILLFFVCLSACKKQSGIRYSDQKNMKFLAINEEQLNEAKTLGLILRDDRICQRITVDKQINLPEYSSPFGDDENWSLLLNEFAYFYSLFGENIGHPEAYRTYNLITLITLVNEIALGNFVPQCADISKISAQILTGRSLAETH